MRKLSFQIYARKYLFDEEKKGKLMNIEHMCMFLGESKEKVKKRFAPTVVFPKKSGKISFHPRYAAFYYHPSICFSTQNKYLNN